MEDNWTSIIGPFLTTFFISALVYIALINWLGLSPTLLIFISVVIVGALVIIGSRITNINISKHEEEFSELSRKIDNLEELINKKLDIPNMAQEYEDKLVEINDRFDDLENLINKKYKKIIS